MLKKLRVAFAVHLHAATDSFNQLCCKPLSTILTVAVIAIALTLPALSWVCVKSLRQLTHFWQHGHHIALYLKQPLSEQVQQETLVAVKKIPGVGEAVLKTPADALKEMEQQEGMAEMLHHLPENPFPAVIELTPAVGWTHTRALNQLFEQLKNLPHIDQARLDKEWLTRLNTLIAVISKITNALMLLLALAVIFIIGNILRLSIRNREEEIKVLKLIGATHAYIIRPFLYEGVWYGLFGAIFAVLFANIFMLSLTVILQDVASAFHMTMPLLNLDVSDAYYLLFFAILLGWMGARISIKSQLSFLDRS